MNRSVTRLDTLAQTSVHGDEGILRGLVESQVRIKGLTIEIEECPPALAVRADEEKLRQILANLISNAMKLTPRGGRISLSWIREGGDVHIAVRDTGIGIPAGKLDSIFEPFVQVRAGLTRTADGTGLGLAISHDVAVLWVGEPDRGERPGEGSTFRVRLPRGGPGHPAGEV